MCKRSSWQKVRCAERRMKSWLMAWSLLGFLPDFSRFATPGKCSRGPTLSLFLMSVFESHQDIFCPKFVIGY
ncbi:hypothetical protein CEXT_633701 [Caerostris extrusa]|uniref:Uncharacterized protein n=1 Tax=Caerostris extrusa TaxID=172846 RepID=A0AAV4MMC9_CAEEX|nr:hypothetical protein CEXT_633701 [Caerostris extrusa]